MNLVLQITIAINSLAFTLPIVVRCAFAVGDWIDETLEDMQRKKKA